MLVDMTNAELLKAWGAEQHASQQQAAEALGIGQAHFNHLIRGNRSPSLALAVRIEEVSRDWHKGSIEAVHWVDSNMDAA